jgi:hypothetical protein
VATFTVGAAAGGTSAYAMCSTPASRQDRQGRTTTESASVGP